MLRKILSCDYKKNLFLISVFVFSFIPNCSATPPVWRNASATWFPTLHLKKEKKIVFVIPSYKNAEWYACNLDSVFAQKYENYRVIYIDDCSPDQTADLVEKYVESKKQTHRFTLLKNSERMGALSNIYHAVHSCADDEIVAQLDGDDWLACNNVLQIINEAYEDPFVWMTYGQYVWHPYDDPGLCKELPREVILNNSYRMHHGIWVTSQLRTFYAGLFKKIKEEDLKFNGKFLPMAWDVAYMLPLLEMANGRFKFIPHITYVYNCVTPINDHKINRPLQVALDSQVRKRAPYQPLQELLTQTDNSCLVKEHEQWWERVLDKKKSMEWFSNALGDAQTVSRVKVRSHILKMNYRSLLDIPCGLCVDYEIKKHSPCLVYLGIDISPLLVKYAHHRGIDAIYGSIEKIALPDSSFDLCYARHILEHLDYYEKAIDELIRVAKKEVLVVFFIKPHDKDDEIDRRDYFGSPLHHNVYNKTKLEEYVKSHEKVDSIAWEEVSSIENIMHVYLKE